MGARFDHARYSETRRITLIAAFVNLLLGSAKIFFGWLGNSQALIADGWHSISDLVTDALVIFAARMGSHAADPEHPYGHGRIETVATVALAILVMLVGFGIIWDSVHHLGHHEAVESPSYYVIILAAISLLANESLFRFTLAIGKRLKSNLVIANAWHSRSDAASSLIVLIGVTASVMGYPLFDEIAALIVAGLIIKMGWELAWRSLQELVDTAVDEGLLAEFKHQLLQVTGVRAIHQLRTRSVGGEVFLDVHILVDSTISVSEGHHIGECAEQALLDKFNQVTDVTVHIDPENDESGAVSAHLPARAVIEKQLAACWEKIPSFSQYRQLLLHYHEGRINIDVILPEVSVTGELSELEREYQQSVNNITGIGKVRLLLTI